MTLKKEPLEDNNNFILRTQDIHTKKLYEYTLIHFYTNVFPYKIFSTDQPKLPFLELRLCKFRTKDWCLLTCH